MRHVAAAMMTLGTLALPSAARAEVIRVDGVFAAGAREASMLPTIAVGGFDGPAGGDAADAIERELASLGDDGVPHATLVAPTARADGVLVGRTDVDVADDDYVETRRRCVEKDKAGKCVRREKYEVRCLRRSVTLRVDLRMARAADDRLVYQDRKTRDHSESSCEDEASLASDDAVLRSMIREIARAVRRDLAPRRERYAVRVREDRSGLPSAGAERFRAAVRTTKRDQVAACAQFVAVGDLAPDHGATLFNRALCAEAEGRYDEASDLYARARVFGGTYGDAISKGAERVAALRAGAEDVARMTAALR